MKKLQAIRQAQSWQDKLDIAQDRTPGTQFDHIFALVKDARFFVTTVKLPGERRARLEALGGWLADLIEKKGSSQTIHDMAKALNIWHRHKPHPDKIRAAFTSLVGMFPEYKLWRKDIRARLKRKGIPIDDAAERKISRVNVELGSPLRHRRSPDRPRGQKRRK